MACPPHPRSVGPHASPHAQRVSPPSSPPPGREEDEDEGADGRPREREKPRGPALRPGRWARIPTRPGTPRPRPRPQPDPHSASCPSPSGRRPDRAAGPSRGPRAQPGPTLAAPAVPACPRPRPPPSRTSGLGGLANLPLPGPFPAAESVPRVGRRCRRAARCQLRELTSRGWDSGRSEPPSGWHLTNPTTDRRGRRLKPLGAHAGRPTAGASPCGPSCTAHARGPDPPRLQTQRQPPSAPRPKQQKLTTPRARDGRPGCSLPRKSRL